MNDTDISYSTCRTCGKSSNPLSDREFSEARIHAYADLTSNICEALSKFFATTTELGKPLHVSLSYGQGSDPVSEDEQRPVDGAAERPVSDPMTLEDIQSELGLKQMQLLKLRRVADFPASQYYNHRLGFSRQEVEEWVALQPNRNDLASVIRRPRLGPRPHKNRAR